MVVTHSDPARQTLRHRTPSAALPRISACASARGRKCSVRGKTWERGAPQVGVEIIGPSDAKELAWAQKFERYRQAGVAELVRFNVLDDTPVLTLWDLVDGDLVERDLGDPEARFSGALGFYWCVVPDKRLKAMLRLARDRDGTDLLPTPAEHAAKQAKRTANEAARARIAELEAELARRPAR